MAGGGGAARRGLERCGAGAGAAGAGAGAGAGGGAGAAARRRAAGWGGGGVGAGFGERVAAGARGRRDIGSGARLVGFDGDGFAVVDAGGAVGERAFLVGDEPGLDLDWSTSSSERVPGAGPCRRWRRPRALDRDGEGERANLHEVARLEVRRSGDGATVELGAVARAEVLELDEVVARPGSRRAGD